MILVPREPCYTRLVLCLSLLHISKTLQEITECPNTALQNVAYRSRMV